MKGAKSMANPFGALIRQRRKEKELTLGRVAEALGLSVTFFSEVERGEKPPLQEAYLPELARVLALSVEELRDAARDSRQQFRLDAGVSPAHRNFASALERRWTTLTEAEIREMSTVLGRVGDRDGRSRK